jgi:hypothetical protein
VPGQRDSEVGDVLERHHAKNRRPRAPNPEKLNRIRNASKEIPDEEDPDTGSGSDTSRHLRRAKRYSRTPKSEIEAKPTQMGFYDGHWRDVLDAAKLNFRRWLACIDAFPTRQAHLSGEVAECVSEARAEYSDKGHSLGRGRFLPVNLPFLTLIPAFQLQKFGNSTGMIWRSS